MTGKLLVLGTAGLIGLWFILPRESCGPDDARVTSAGANMNTIRVNLLSYQMAADWFPTTQQGLKALVQNPTIEPLPVKWRKILDEVPRDPWGTEFQYRNPGSRHPAGYDLFSAGPDRKAGTEDDIWAGWSPERETNAKSGS